MKEVRFILSLWAGIIALIVVCHSNIFAQDQWKEVTLNGSSEVGAAPFDFIPFAQNTYPKIVTRDSKGNIYAALGRGVFKWDGKTWTELGTGSTALNSNEEILTLATDKAGSVYAAGYLTRNGRYYVAKWDGVSWSELGGGATALNADNTINALTVDPKGNVYAAGNFDNAGLYNYVAVWNGISWSQVGPDDGADAFNSISTINTLASDSSGNIYAAGTMTNESDHLYVTRWNGSKWQPLGDDDAFSGNQITALAADKNNHIYAIGDFNETDHMQYTAEWDGSAWRSLGTGNNALKASSIVLAPNQSLYALGTLASPDGDGLYLRKWDGTKWIKQGSYAPGIMIQMATDNSGRFYGAGLFVKNKKDNYYVAQWESGNWSETGGGDQALDAKTAIMATLVAPSGKLYAAGKFVDTLGRRYVAVWDGKIWSELGTGDHALRANGDINALAIDKAGNIYAAGDFKNASQKRYVAKWNGTAWSELGGGTAAALFANATIVSLAVDKDNNVYASGDFTNTDNYYYVAKWNGALWQELGTGNNRLRPNNRLYALATDTEGNIYTGGDFTNADGYHYVARWNGSSWNEVGSNPDGAFIQGSVTALSTDSAGNIYAGGYFTTNSDTPYVAKFDKTSWSVLSNGLFKGNGSGQKLLALQSDRKGNIYIGGLINNAAGGKVIQRWDGAFWSLLGDAKTYPIGGQINSIALNLSDNTVYAGGTFQNSRFLSYVEGLKQGAVLADNDLDFTAALQNSNAVLNWRSNGNIRVASFTVQRSIDGRSYGDVGKVAAKGSERHYSFTDNAIAGLQTSNLYYRLAQTDQEGHIIYSNVVILYPHSNEAHVIIYPNPVGNAIMLHATKNLKDAVIKVSDAHGRLLYVARKDLLNGSPFLIDASLLAHGIYYIKIDASNKHETIKALK